jgi:pimeloyl-ACP methyl ester carboxylesterase
MIFKLRLLLLFPLIFSVLSVQAKTLVLVHGYMSNGMDWRHSGFTQPLRNAGWQDGGGYGYSSQAMLLPRGLLLKGDVFFTVELPSQANIQVQESLLARYLSHLYSQRQEPITLVGHSAGGVVSRLYTLNPAHQPINGLITIASPHLGTPAANIAYLAGNSPLGMMASMVGGEELQNSSGLFSDLREEEPYNFLFLMNRQPHPNIHYASIIRINKILARPDHFDFIVPPSSQNMNNVWALRNRSGVAKTTDSHSLNSKDGFLTVEILNFIN